MTIMSFGFSSGLKVCYDPASLYLPLQSVGLSDFIAI